MFDTSIFFPGRVKMYKFCVSVLKTSRRRTEHRFCCLLSLLRVVEKLKLYMDTIRKLQDSTALILSQKSFLKRLSEEI